MLQPLKNVVVLGGSYVGLNAVKELAAALPASHRILLVEPHTHFHHLFAFPRFSVLPKHEHKAFIPYTAVFAGSPDSSRHQVIQARAHSLFHNRVVLDRDWQGSTEIPFDYLVVTTGTQLPAPGTMQHDDKLSSVKFLQSYQGSVIKASSIVIVGGGAVGVQMATDLKELYPEKEITLVHSRDCLMPLYHIKFHEVLKSRFDELGVKLITGTRAVFPPVNLVHDDTKVVLKLTDGRELVADLVIPATGQKPNSGFVQTLQSSNGDPILNPSNGFIKVRPTLQFKDPAYPNLFAAGDIADTGAHKAARPGMAQAQVAAQNIVAMIEGRDPVERFTVRPPGIHISLGLKKNMKFINPDVAAGETEPTVIMQDNGQEDLKIETVWKRRGVSVSDPREYHL
ncbi:FAD/NAD(P)-binding domain-containing protein [Colletotrichum zoysiae]|uniref:FAD/NAD(P)-binding domain-containing protein n=1 Tax=Colletotrichum zoysiae TaxID=1216348 RepID=A0AAD9M0G6_9PEZI|nr:FAD/NAD(P)-binding domain-containing protein [Colletotrichum zoysiae]